MTDYHPLIARAVEGLDRSTGEARRALYERARNALVAQLRSNQPALLEADITKERLALEEAIRKVEAEAARKSRSEPCAEQRTAPRSATPPAGTPGGAPQVRHASGAPRRDRSSPPPADLPRAGWTAVLPSARERLLRGWSSLKKQGVKGFRNVVGEVHDLARQQPATEEPALGAHRLRAPLVVNGHVEPLLLSGGQVVKALPIAFLADFEKHWRTHGRKVLDRLAEKYPQAYFGGAVALAKAIRWETGEDEADGVR
jgi:hypothetical protein